MPEGAASVCQASLDVAARYATTAKKALEDKDYRTALIAYERLTALDGTRAEYRHGLALALDALGQKQRACAVMHSLAPPEQLGHAPARTSGWPKLW